MTNKPPNNWTPTKRLINQLVYKRKDAVRIRPEIGLSAVADRGNKSFVDVITHFVDDMNAKDRLEKMIYVGEEQTETLLKYYPHARNSDETTQYAHESRATQQTSSEGNNEGSAGPEGSEETSTLNTRTEQANRKLEEEIKAILGDTVTVDRVDWYPKPLGRTPLATYRLVLPASEESARVSNATPPPVDLLIKKLKKLQKPFLYQLLIKKTSDSKIVVTVRLTVIDNTQTIVDSTDFFRLLKDSRKIDVGDLFKAANITTNANMPLYKYFREIEPDNQWLFTRGPITWDRATEARQIYTGEREYERLLRGDLGYAEEYTTHLGYPKFPIELEHLQHLVTLPAIQYESDPWEDVHGRGPPHVVQTGLPLADLLDEEELDLTFLPDDGLEQHEASVQRGSDGHDANLDKGLERLRRRDWQVVKVVQKSNTSLPDAVGYDPEGNLFWIEYEHTLTSPENYIKNAARAADAGVKLILITRPDVDESVELARVQANLRKPFKSASPYGTLLYNRSQVKPEDNRKPLLPSSLSESKWVVTRDHNLVLRGDNRELASGPIDKSVKTFEYNCPHYRRDGNEYIVEDAVGRTLDRFSSRDALFEEYTAVQKPHVPLMLSYAGIATIMYLGREELQTFEETPGWTRIEGKMLRYQQSAKQFIDRFTMKHPNHEIPLSELHKYYKRWARRQTDKKLPNIQKFGQAIGNIQEKAYARKRAGAGGRKGSTLVNRTWIYPPEVRSPDLPHFDADTLDRLEDLLNE